MVSEDEGGGASDELLVQSTSIISANGPAFARVGGNGRLFGAFLRKTTERGLFKRQRERGDEVKGGRNLF